MLQWKYSSMLLPCGWSQVSFPNLVLVFLLLVFGGYVGLLLKIVCVQSIKCMSSYDAKVWERVKVRYMSVVCCVLQHTCCSGFLPFDDTMLHDWVCVNPSAWSDGHCPHTVNITCCGVTGTARMLHALTHSSIFRQVREQM